MSDNVISIRRKITVPRPANNAVMNPDPYPGLIRFKKGQSGNPGGRPRAVGEINALARSHAPEAITRLLYWIRQEDAKTSIAACIGMLNRGCGLPMQSTELSGPGGVSLSPPSLQVNFVAGLPQPVEQT